MIVWLRSFSDDVIVYLQGFSPIVTSQDSTDSFLASPVFVEAKNKKKRKSEPKGRQDAASTEGTVNQPGRL